MRAVWGHVLAWAGVVCACSAGCGSGVKPAARPWWVGADRATLEARYPAGEYLAAEGMAEGGAEDRAARRRAEVRAVDEMNRMLRVSVAGVVEMWDKAATRYRGGRRRAEGESVLVSRIVSESGGGVSGVRFSYWYDRGARRHHVLGVAAVRENYRAALRKGMSAMGGGKYRAAAGYFAAAAALQPREAEPLFRLGTVLEKAGDLEGAAAAYEEAAAGTRGGEWKRSARERLRLVRDRLASVLAGKARKCGLEKGAALLRRAYGLASGRRREEVGCAYRAFVLRRAAEGVAAAAVRAGVKRVAVLDFRDEFGRKSAAGVRTAGALAAEIARAGGGRVSVVERERITDVIRETDVLEPLGLREMGKRFGAEGLVVGTVGRRLNVRLLRRQDAGILAAVSEEWIAPGRGGTAAEEKKGNEEIGLQIAIFGQRKIGGEWVDVDVRDGSVLSSGDLFKIRFSPDRDAYVYVVLYDSAGKASVLFPGTGFLASRVKGGGVVMIPRGADRWYWLDERTGDETLYFIASVEPLADIEKLLPEMEKAGGGRRLAEAIRMRGIGGVTTGAVVTVTGKHGRDVKKVSEVVKGTGAAVRVFTIHHR